MKKTIAVMLFSLLLTGASAYAGQSGYSRHSPPDGAPYGHTSPRPGAQPIGHPPSRHPSWSRHDRRDERYDRQPSWSRHDRRDNDATGETIVGGVLGGFLGNAVTDEDNRVPGTIFGAILGAVVGHAVGRNR